MDMNEKRCPKCKQIKSLVDFHRHKTTKDGRSCWCAKCSNKNALSFSKTPSGVYTRIKGRTKHYNKIGSSRAKSFNIERKEFIDWYNNQKRVCVYCGIPEKNLYLIKDGHNNTPLLTVDCKDNDLGYTLNNLVLCCYRCNSLKSNVFTFEEMVFIGQSLIKPKWQALITSYH